jgi:MOSC domain-containing protein YiiM
MRSKVLGTVVRLYVSKADGQKREERETLSIEADGVWDDKFKGKDSQRSVLLVAQCSYEITKKSGVSISAGELGENILFDFNLYSFNNGTRLQVGDVVVEITQKSSLCRSLSKISSKLPMLLRDKRGMFAKAINPGTIKRGDSVCLIHQSAT